MSLAVKSVREVKLAKVSSYTGAISIDGEYSRAAGTPPIMDVDGARLDQTTERGMKSSRCESRSLPPWKSDPRHWQPPPGARQRATGSPRHSPPFLIVRSQPQPAVLTHTWCSRMTSHVDTGKRPAMLSCHSRWLLYHRELLGGEGGSVGIGTYGAGDGGGGGAGGLGMFGGDEA